MFKECIPFFGLKIDIQLAEKCNLLQSLRINELKLQWIPMNKFISFGMVNLVCVSLGKDRSLSRNRAAFIVHFWREQFKVIRSIRSIWRFWHFSQHFKTSFKFLPLLKAITVCFFHKRKMNKFKKEQSQRLRLVELWFPSTQIHMQRSERFLFVYVHSNGIDFQL